jgi:hypothetical protein
LQTCARNRPRRWPISMCPGCCACVRCPADEALRRRKRRSARIRVRRAHAAAIAARHAHLAELILRFGVDTIPGVRCNVSGPRGHSRDILRS